MPSIKVWALGMAAVFAMLFSVVAAAVPAKGEQVPSFRALDIRGQEVDLDTIMGNKPDLVILFFFTTSTGEEIAVKLRRLDALYKEKLRIVAIGWKEDEPALKKFADDLAIDYYIIKDTPELGSEKNFGPFTTLPLTFILTNKKVVLKSLVGSGKAEADVISDVANVYFQQRKTEQAKAVAEVAIEAGEDPKVARNVKGFALAAEGKLDEAQAEFGQIDSKEGLAMVALEKGDAAKAIELASAADPGNAYAETVKGTALMRTGKLDEAQAAFNAAAAKPAEDWQKAEAVNGAGRIAQEKGDVDTAIKKYQESVALDPYNVVALSNEGAAYRQKGDLKKAEEVLSKAQEIRDDGMVKAMLQQIQKEMKEANDVKRGELIRSQINDLKARYEALKASGKEKPLDEWSTRPMVLAFLPSTSEQTAFFDRAGTDVVLQREIEARVQADGRVKLVERAVLDKLLQELNLGSSDLAKQDTQLQLGKVMSARMLGFIDFATLGADTIMYIRLIDTETTSIAAQIKRSVKDLSNLDALVDGVVQEIVKKAAEDRQMQGLIADASADDAVIINLGKAHGAKPGQKFMVVKEGEPIEAGGKVIAHREAKVAMLEVTSVEDEYAICKVVKKEEGVQLTKEMRIKQTMTQ
ncbi:MAG TPA: tetratricopeptide repeat protein [Candidatus Hydrogenedentes bacterium]|nr:tetratricopeptide repeat protein [Candidatus Hydrogenedentota bacterium]HPC18263.1 tetratricopeptide repeat protein [Candidatus Hydrogenedentota bacterium]HRT20566.1 tetratricopeptide repeat protein [Candidatus Hydrogenedentota bacterium]HRT65229.1 tetratricopeptide repeat protein [Candidatus Hydrogenedentota bacterium]